MRHALLTLTANQTTASKQKHGWLQDYAALLQQHAATLIQTAVLDSNVPTGSAWNQARNQTENPALQALSAFHPTATTDTAAHQEPAASMIQTALN